MAAGGRGVMRPVFEAAIGQHTVARRRAGDEAPARADAIAFGGDAQDFIALAHWQAA